MVIAPRVEIKLNDNSLHSLVNTTLCKFSTLWLLHNFQNYESTEEEEKEKKKKKKEENNFEI